MKKSTLVTVVLGVLTALPVFAEEAAGAVHGGGLTALGAGLAIGLAALGGAIGQGLTAASALDGIARNPAAQQKVFVPMLLAMALVEALVVLAWLVANTIADKI